MQQITENSLNVCANGITSEEISEIRNCIRRIARRRELEGKKPTGNGTASGSITIPEETKVNRKQIPNMQTT